MGSGSDEGVEMMRLKKTMYIFTAIMFRTENGPNDGFMLFAKYKFVNDFKWAGLFRVT